MTRSLNWTVHFLLEFFCCNFKFANKLFVILNLNVAFRCRSFSFRSIYEKIVNRIKNDRLFLRSLSTTIIKMTEERDAEEACDGNEVCGSLRLTFDIAIVPQRMYPTRRVFWFVHLRERLIPYPSGYQTLVKRMHVNTHTYDKEEKRTIQPHQMRWCRVFVARIVHATFDWMKPSKRRFFGKRLCCTQHSRGWVYTN